MAYRRLSTTIVLPSPQYGAASRQAITIDPLDLAGGQKEGRGIGEPAAVAVHATAERVSRSTPYGARPYAALRIRSADFSPTMMHGALVLPDGMVGKIEASAMRRPSRPCTLSRSSTTVLGPAGPMRQVPIG